MYVKQGYLPKWYREQIIDGLEKEIKELELKISRK